MSLTLFVANPWHPDGPRTVADVDVTLKPIRAAWVTERGDNPGASITNIAETIYLRAQELAGPCAVVECYRPSSWAGGRPGPETFDLVTLEGGVAHWYRLGESRTEALEALTSPRVLEALMRGS